MPVFKAFFAIAKKRRNAALIYLGVYAVITLLLSALSQDSITRTSKPASALSPSQMKTTRMQAALCAITSHPSTR